MRKTGFTLIEMLVVVGVLGVIMSGVAGVLINSFKAKSRIDLADKIQQNGNRALSELKGEIINAVGVGMTCSGDRVTYVNAIDGGTTTIICYEGASIASESASGDFNLTNSDVAVSGCNNFVKCNIETGYASKINQVNFAFSLITGGVQDKVSRSFQSNVVVRN